MGDPGPNTDRRVTRFNPWILIHRGSRIEAILRGDSQATPEGEEARMRKRRSSDEQIAMALPQVEAWTPVAEVCRKMQAAESTFVR